MSDRQRMVLILGSTVSVAILILILAMILGGRMSAINAYLTYQTKIHSLDEFSSPVDSIPGLGNDFKIMTLKHDGHRITVNSMGGMMHHPQCDACLNFIKEEREKERREARKLEEFRKWSEERFQKPEKPAERSTPILPRARVKPAVALD